LEPHALPQYHVEKVCVKAPPPELLLELLPELLLLEVLPELLLLELLPELLLEPVLPPPGHVVPPGSHPMPKLAV
jgi:hypothetical protein